MATNFLLKKKTEKNAEFGFPGGTNTAGINDPLRCHIPWVAAHERAASSATRSALLPLRLVLHNDTVARADARGRVLGARVRAAVRVLAALLVALGVDALAELLDHRRHAVELGDAPYVGSVRVARLERVGIPRERARGGGAACQETGERGARQEARGGAAPTRRCARNRGTYVGRPPSASAASAWCALELALLAWQQRLKWARRERLPHAQVRVVRRRQHEPRVRREGDRADTLKRRGGGGRRRSGPSLGVAASSLLSNGPAWWWCREDAAAPGRAPPVPGRPSPLQDVGTHETKHTRVQPHRRAEPLACIRRVW